MDGHGWQSMGFPSGEHPKVMEVPHDVPMKSCECESAWMLFSCSWVLVDWFAAASLTGVEQTHLGFQLNVQFVLSTWIC